jgi:hypothetical protein
MKRALIVIVVACVACKGKPDCGRTIGDAFDRVEAMELKEIIEGQRTRLVEHSRSLRRTITERCRSDAWSAETIECFGSSKSEADVRACGSTLSATQASSLRREVAAAGMPSVTGLIAQQKRPLLEILGEAQSELREATRQLLAAGLPSDGRSSETDEELTHARETVMAEKGIPIKELQAGLDLALQYRIEVIIPALIVARPTPPK